MQTFTAIITNAATLELEIIVHATDHMEAVEIARLFAENEGLGDVMVEVSLAT